MRQHHRARKSLTRVRRAKAFLWPGKAPILFVFYLVLMFVVSMYLIWVRLRDRQRAERRLVEAYQQWFRAQKRPE